MTQEAYKILKGIPLKKGKKTGPSSKLTQTMMTIKIGECFDYPFKGKLQNAKASCYMAAKRAGIKISIPDAEGSPMRIWRVK